MILGSQSGTHRGHIHMPYSMMHQRPLPLLLPDHSTVGMFLEQILQKSATGEEDILSITGFLSEVASDYQKRSLFNKIDKSLAWLVNLGCVAHACRWQNNCSH